MVGVRPGARALEKVDAVIFGKIGALMLGKPAVVAIKPASGSATENMLRFAPRLKRNSEHPLRAALL